MSWEDLGKSYNKLQLGRFSRHQNLPLSTASVNHCANFVSISFDHRQNCSLQFSSVGPLERSKLIVHFCALSPRSAFFARDNERAKTSYSWSIFRWFIFGCDGTNTYTISTHASSAHHCKSYFFRCNSDCALNCLCFWSFVRLTNLSFPWSHRHCSSCQRQHSSLCYSYQPFLHHRFGLSAFYLISCQRFSQKIV